MLKSSVFSFVLLQMASNQALCAEKVPSKVPSAREKFRQNSRRKTGEGSEKPCPPGFPILRSAIPPVSLRRSNVLANGFAVKIAVPCQLANALENAEVVFVFAVSDTVLRLDKFNKVAPLES